MMMHNLNCVHTVVGFYDISNYTSIKLIFKIAHDLFSHVVVCHSSSFLNNRSFTEIAI